MNSVRGGYLISIFQLWFGCLSIGLVATLSLTCCAGPQAQPQPGKIVSGEVSGENISGSSERVTIDDVAAIAKKVDLGFEDGWIAGREARFFRSPYRTLSAHDKAQFALAYHDFLEPFHQDLGNNLATYVPYKTRAAFARQYWLSSSSGEKFKNEKEKYQVAWIHESLLDGSELWWRAAEKRFGSKIDSVLALVHDTEQNMVAKYMEDEKTEGTFSGQMSDKSIKKPKSVN
jgi:hypothetical protein